MEEDFLHAGFSYLPSKPSISSSCFPTQLLLAMNSQLDKTFIILEPANEPPPLPSLASFFTLLYAPSLSRFLSLPGFSTLSSLLTSYRPH